jgi:D-beta-D-heptose 7-phosphate kinase/D-beta-D-heptose 1-phosphate adenosyltransferase
VLVKGGDYRRDQVVGGEVVEADGGEVILVDLLPGHSTTGIVRRSARPVETAETQPARPQPTLTKPVVPS